MRLSGHSKQLWTGAGFQIPGESLWASVWNGGLETSSIVLHLFYFTESKEVRGGVWWNDHFLRANRSLGEHGSGARCLGSKSVVCPAREAPGTIGPNWFIAWRPLAFPCWSLLENIVAFFKKKNSVCRLWMGFSCLLPPHPSYLLRVRTGFLDHQSVAKCLQRCCGGRKTCCRRGGGGGGSRKWRLPIWASPPSRFHPI